MVQVQFRDALVVLAAWTQVGASPQGVGSQARHSQPLSVKLWGNRLSCLRNRKNEEH